MMRPALKELIPAEALRAAPDPDALIGWYFGWGLAAFMVGAAIGGAVFGRIGDRIGRTKAMMLTIVIYAVFTGLTAFVTTYPQLLACRFLGALGLGGEWGVGVALLVETWPEKRRPLVAGIAGCAINVGFLCAGYVTKWIPSWRGVLGDAAVGIPDWRLAFAVGALPAVLTLAVRVWVPEPERWKRVKEKAERIPLTVLFSPAYRRNTLLAALLSGVALLGTWGSFLWLSAWIDKISHDPAARSEVQVWQAWGMIAGSLLGGPLAEWMGRRRCYAFLCVTAWLSVLALYGLNDTYTGQVRLLAVVAGFFVTAFFGWAPLYLPELFPTHLRAYGQGLSFNLGRFLTAAGAVLGGQLVSFFGGSYPKAMMWMASIYLVGLVAIRFAPETKGKALPE
jgi:MFS family permease